jgi:hypothetical protein
MSRLCVVPWLVLSLFLTGCKSAPQAGTDGAAPPGKFWVADLPTAAADSADGWVQKHPAVRDGLVATGAVVGVAAGVALVVFLLYAELHKPAD